MSAKRSKVLEVIVNSLGDAIEAEQGGADRLEVVRNLEVGGLTPSLDLIHQILSSIKLPIRVMLRENASMSVEDANELDLLCRTAAELNSFPIDGLVAGFVKNSEVDLDAMRAIALAAPQLKITFHRAFDDLPDPLLAIRSLKTIPQVDRILTIGGSGSWPERKLCLHNWQRYAVPEITILAGAGVLEPVINDLQRDDEIREIHIGRAARIPSETDGKVCRFQVAQLKGHRA